MCTPPCVLRSRQLCSYSRTSQDFMEHESSLPCSQQSSTGPYPEPNQFSPCHPILHHLRSILILSTHLLPRLHSGFFPPGFSTNIHPICTFLRPIRGTCPRHLILLDLIILTLLRENYKLRSPSFCSFLTSPFTSSLVGQNILLSTLLSNTLSPRGRVSK
jgi:hypothetical protein